jgi:hypothetical protein
MLEDWLLVAGNGGGDTFAFKTGVSTPPNPDTHRGLVTFMASASANNAVSFTETFAADDAIALTAGRIASQILPFDVTYAGSGTTFAQGVSVSTGTGHNTVNVQSTSAGARTTVALNGDDRVNVSSDAPYNYGTFGGLAGGLTAIDNTGLAGLTISERGPVTSRGVVLGDSVQVSAAGVSSTSRGWQVGTAGSFGHGVTVLLSAGPDSVDVSSTAPGGRTTVDTGGGRDVVTVHVNSTVLAHPDLLISNSARLSVADEEDGAVMHNDAANGVLRVWYVSGAPSTISYRNVASVVPSVDADHSFVRSLFHTVLHRNALTPEVEPLVTLLRQQTNPDPAARRAVIASQIEHSPEALGLLVDRWYPALLATTPTASQRAALVRYLAPFAAPEEELVRVLCNSVALSQQPFGGPPPTTPAGFVTRLYQQMLLRAPSAQEVSAGVSYIAARGAGAFGYALATSNEYRRVAVDGYYRRILHRAPTAAELTAAAASALDLTSLRVQIEAGQEFYDTGR